MRRRLQSVVDAASADPRVLVACVLDGDGALLVAAGDARDTASLAGHVEAETRHRLPALAGADTLVSSPDPESGACVHLRLVDARLVLMALVVGPAPSPAVEDAHDALAHVLRADPDSASLPLTDLATWLSR